MLVPKPRYKQKFAYRYNHLIMKDNPTSIKIKALSHKKDRYKIPHKAHRAVLRHSSLGLLLRLPSKKKDRDKTSRSFTFFDYKYKQVINFI